MTTTDYTASAAKGQKLHTGEKMLGNILLLGSYFSVAIIVDISQPKYKANPHPFHKMDR